MIRFSQELDTGEKTEILVHDYLDISDLCGAFQRFLQALGYHISDDEMVDIVPRDDPAPFDQFDAED